MNPKTTIPISEARKKIFQLAEEVQKQGVYYTFTEKGRPKAVLMSAEEFDSILETMEIMRDFPNLDKDIAEADKAVRTGEYKKWITLEALLAKEGFVVAEKAKNKYGISSENKAKSAKRIK